MTFRKTDLKKGRKVIDKYTELKKIQGVGVKEGIALNQKCKKGPAFAFREGFQNSQKNQQTALRSTRYKK